MRGHVVIITHPTDDQRYAGANGLTGFASGSPHVSLAEQIEESWPECVSIADPAGEAARA